MAYRHILDGGVRDGRIWRELVRQATLGQIGGVILKVQIEDMGGH